LYDPESPEERFEPGSEAAEAETEKETAEQFGTIEDAASPTENTAEKESPEGVEPHEGAEPEGNGRA
jgi:hypothetical protein